MKFINNVIREKINIKNSVLDYIRYKQVNWYDHVQRMNEERLSRNILELCPPGRRRKGRMQEIKLERKRRKLITWNGSAGKNGEGK
jgi:hypothetical protein